MRTAFSENAKAMVLVFGEQGAETPRAGQLIGGHYQKRVEFRNALAVPGSRIKDLDVIDFAAEYSGEGLVTLQTRWASRRDSTDGWKNLATVKPGKGLDVIPSKEALDAGAPRIQVTHGDPDRVKMETLHIIAAGRNIVGERVNF